MYRHAFDGSVGVGAGRFGGARLQAAQGGRRVLFGRLPGRERVFCQPDAACHLPPAFGGPGAGLALPSGRCTGEEASAVRRSFPVRIACDRIAGLGCLGLRRLVRLFAPAGEDPKSRGGNLTGQNLAVFFSEWPVAAFSSGGRGAHCRTAGFLVSQPVAGPLPPRRPAPLCSIFGFYSFGDPARPGVTPEHELRLPGDRSGCYGVSAACVVSQCHGGTGNGRQCVLVFMYFAFFGCSSGLGTAGRTGGAGL